MTHAKCRHPIAALALLAVAFAAFPAGAQTADSPVLRERVRVEGDHIRLGDLFRPLAPEKARQNVLRAPRPGQTRRISATRLNRIAKNHDLDWSTQSRGTMTEVHRASHEVPAAKIEAAVRKALESRGLRDNQKITFRNGQRGLTLPASLPATVRLENFAYRESSNRFSAKAIAPAEGSAYARTTVTGRVVRMLDIPVLNERIDRGETIRESDLRWVKRSARDVRNNHITDAKDLAGMNARRPLSPGELIRTTAVEEPILVEDDSLVTIKLQTQQLSLTAKGRALEDGAKSDTIRVENITSQNTVSGVVTAPGVVVVEPRRLSRE